MGSEMCIRDRFSSSGGFFSEFGLELFRRKHTVACASSDFSRKIDPEGKQGKLETRFLHVLPKSFFVVSPTLRAL